MIQYESNISAFHQRNKSKSHKFQEMRKRIDVPQEKRQEIFHELISLSKENILPRGALTRASKKHDFSFQTIKRIWGKGLEPNKRSNSGRKVKWTDDLVKSRIKEVPWENRTS